MTELVLYSTLGCHLCEQAEQLLTQAGLAYRYVDIADEDELLGRYGNRIPVLAMSGRNDELGWPFDQAKLQRYLAGEVFPDLSAVGFNPLAD